MTQVLPKAMRLLVVVAVMVALPAASAANFTYDWATIANQQPMPDVQCGDIITITWPTTQKHGVFRLADPSGACPDTYDAAAGKLLFAPKAGGNFTYTIQNEPDFWLTDPVSTSVDQSNCDDGYAIMLMTSCPVAGNAGSSPATAGNTGTPADHRGSALTAAPAAATVQAASSPPPPSPASGALANMGSISMAMVLLCVALCLQRLL